ncbi:MAG: hypothetical protein ACI8Q1_000284 [Parvicella sp.]|jgi:uncharacterized protein
MYKKNHFVIQYAGLNLGGHDYKFEINETFFESFEYSEIEKCKIDVSLRFEKSTSMITLLFAIKGYVASSCDTCLDDMDLPIEGEYKQIVKISDYAQEDLNSEIMVVPTAEYEMDVEKMIFDVIYLSIPYKKQHEEGQCDPEVLNKMKDYLLTEEVFDEDEDQQESTDEENKEDNNNIDPRWNALKGLNNKD